MSIDIITLTASKNYTDKQIEKASIKGADVSRYVQSVNGVAPDESGNVEIDALPDNAEQIEMLIEADLLPAVHDANGAILTDEKGNVILRY